MDFDYFYEEQSEQFAFYRIPKVFFTKSYFSGISTEAKVLFGLLLDRVALSRENGWLDENGRIYIIYTLDAIEAAMGISDKTATKYLTELERYGLIERKRRGQGKPAVIYVKNFSASEKVRTLNRKIYESATEESTSQESEKVRCNDTDINKTEVNYPYPILSGYDTDERERCRRYFEEELCLESIRMEFPYQRETVDGILELILDVFCSKRKTIRIAGDDKPTDVVKNRFMKLNSAHIDYVLGCLNKNTTKIYNIRQYMLAALYNAPVTMESFYRAWVNNDMATGKI